MAIIVTDTTAAAAAPDYEWLKSAVARWLHRSDLTAIIPDLISIGERRIFREVRTRAMETSLSAVISDGVAEIPSDYIELKHAYIDGTPVQSLERVAPSFIYAKYPTRAATSKPRVIAADAGFFIFGPYPDSGYTLKGVYYKRFAPISSEENALFTESPDLYLFAALAEAAPYLKNDERALVWEAKYAKVRDDINGESRKEAFSGGPLVVRVK